MYNVAVLTGSSTATILVANNAGLLSTSNIGDSGFVIIRNGALHARSVSTQHYFNCPLQLAAVGQSDSPKDATQATFQLQPGDMILAATDGFFDNIFPDQIRFLVNFGFDPSIFEYAEDASGCRKHSAVDAMQQFYEAAQAEGSVTISSALVDMVERRRSGTDAPDGTSARNLPFPADATPEQIVQQLARLLVDAAFTRARTAPDSPWAQAARRNRHQGVTGGKVDDIALILVACV